MRPEATHEQDVTPRIDASGDLRPLTRRAVERGGELEIRFRNFQLFPGSRVLLQDGVVVDLGSRAFDLLHVLAAARGSVVHKDVIVSQVWPTTVVDECNIRYQIASLRRALGGDRDLVKTIAGRGYLFAAESSLDRGSPATGLDSNIAPSASALVVQLARLGPGGGAVGAAIPSRLAESLAACEALSRLLRATLEDVWQIAPDGASGLARDIAPPMQAAQT